MTVPRSTGRATGSASSRSAPRWIADGAHRFRGGDREPCRHARALIDRRRFAQQPGEAGEHLDQVVGHLSGQVRFLAHDGDLVVERTRVVRADLGAEAVLERRDDPTAVGVVLRVGAGDEDDVERQPQRVPADLDVALLHHVEQRYLDPLREIGQLVDRDDAPVGARDETEVDGLGVAEAAALRHLHRVDVADQVRDAGVGGRELLGVALAAVPPRDRQVVAEFGGAPDRRRRDRLVRVLAEFRVGDHRRPFVEQQVQGAQQPGLALPAFTEQDDVVTGQQRPFELWQDGVLEPDDPRPRIAPLTQRGEQIVADFLLDGQLHVPGGTQFPHGLRLSHDFHATRLRRVCPGGGKRREDREVTRAAHPPHASRVCSGGGKRREDPATTAHSSACG